MIKNATRLKKRMSTTGLKKRRKRKNEGGREREGREEWGRRRGKKTLSNLFSVCAAAREAVSRPAACVMLQATAGKFKAVCSEQHNKYLLKMHFYF